MRVRIEFQGPGFVAVPNHVAAMIGRELSPDALAVLVRLALLPNGSSWSVDSIRKMLAMGDHRWRAAAACLRAVGALWDDRLTGEDGRHRGSVLSVRWPDAPAGKRASTARPVGKPARGKPTALGVGKPARGKSTARCAQVIEIEGEKPSEIAQEGVALKTKTDGGAAAPPALAAAPPSGALPSSDAGADSAAEAERVAYLERVLSRPAKRSPVRPNAPDAVQNGGKVGDADRLASEVHALRLRRGDGEEGAKSGGKL